MACLFSSIVRAMCVAACAWGISSLAPSRPLIAQEPAESPGAQTPGEQSGDSRSDMGSASEVETRIHKALETKTAIQFLDTPLVEVVQFLAEHHKIPIQIDRRALDDSGVPVDLPITADIRGARLGTALDLILNRHDLAHMYHNESLLITTRDSGCGGTEYPHVYAMADLLGDNPKSELDQWSKLLKTTQIPWSWDEQAGTGSVSAFRNTLVVMQSPEVHGRIADLLRAVREVKQANANEGTAKYLPMRARDHAAFVAWNTQLNRRVDIDFREIPLVDVQEYLQDLTGLPVQLDMRALEDNGISPDLPLTFQQHQISLRAALNFMLRRHALGWHCSGEVLLITTADVAAHELEDLIYPVADLAGQADGTHQCDELVELLQSTVRPDSWSIFGGPGAIVGTPDGKMLVVAQTRECHEQIGGLLKELRRKVVFEPKKPKPDGTLK